ncbi:TolC family protein [Pontibacter kalidii]|uniref:TolC family protein n=1 Tax=Pontibacter kalidii TaxID=2592049 RepID=UPI00224F7899|nr:TolC family protein [Pontibacter kalidii]
MQHGKLFLFLLLLTVSTHPLSAQNAAALKLNLEDLFEMAEAKNRALKISDYNRQLADAAVTDAKKKALPSLEASVSASYLGDGWIADRDFSNGLKAPMPHFGNNFAIEASQVIYAGGAVDATIKNAELGEQVAALQKDNDRQGIRFLLAGYYLEMAKLENQKQVLQNSISQTQKLLEQINAKYKQGLALRSNITRYELQLKSLELNLVKLENSSTILNSELATALNLPKGTTIQVDELQTIAPNYQADPNYWQDLAVANAPVLKQLDLRAEQSKNQETLARADKKPQVVAFAANKLDGPVVIEVPPLDKNFNYWYLGVGLTYNIASLYKADSRVNLAQLSMQKVLEQNELVKDNLFQEIHAAYIRYQETFQVYDTHLKSQELANENYTVIRNRYLDELVLITEMLDAQNAKIDAELQAANAQINILFSFYNLKKLTGTL